MNFCSGCGEPVSRKTPDDDHRERWVCDSCG
ncbi:MAG: zinc ribbon domain-containing protein, partial [Gammaproteobacteria bacterium]|nr:zinc ribbon domain-containing protein [Gammaproteobacteria bacterium]